MRVRIRETEEDNDVWMRGCGGLEDEKEEGGGGRL